MTGPRYLNKHRDEDDEDVSPSFIANQLEILRQLDFNSGSVSSGYSAHKPEALHFDSENNSTNTDIAMNNNHSESESEDSTPDKSRSSRSREDGGVLASGGSINTNTSRESDRELERLRREISLVYFFTHSST